VASDQRVHCGCGGLATRAGVAQPRSLGALYLQQSLRMAFTDPNAEQTVITDFNTAQDAEYAEVLERLLELRREFEDAALRADAPEPALPGDPTPHSLQVVDRP
jgi:hypothetical protein